MATTHVPVTMGTLSALLIIVTSVLVSTWCAFNILHSKEQCSKGFACSVQMLMSVPLVMVAVVTHVPTPSAPTTAPVILGTDWVTTAIDVTVSGWNVLCLSSKHSVVSQFLCTLVSIEKLCILCLQSHS